MLGKNREVFLYAYTKFNLGDDLFLYILATTYPECKFYVTSDLDYSKNFLNKVENLVFIKKNRVSFFNRLGVYLSSVLKLTKLKGHLLERVIGIQLGEVMAKCDSVVVVGGSMFIQKKYEVNTYDMIMYKYFSSFKDKKKFILGSNFGPFQSEDYYSFFYRVFQDFDLINFRELKSVGLFSDLKNVKYVPDLVLTLPIKEFNISTDKKEKSVGFSLVDVDKFENSIDLEVYLSNLVELVLFYFNLNYKIKFYSFSDVEGDYLIINELQSIILEKYNVKSDCLSYDGSIEFVTKFCNNEINVCSRFHGMILSLISDCKVVAVPYSAKMTNVIEDYNLNVLNLDMKVKYTQEFLVGELTRVFTLENNLKQVVCEAEQNLIFRDERKK